jgi:hypothetical protein
VIHLRRVAVKLIVHSDFEEWLVTDESWMGLFESCVEHADICPLAARSSDPVELEAMAWNAIVGLKWKPMPLGGVLLDYSSILAIIALAQYRASSYAKMSNIIDKLIDGPSDELEALVQSVIPSISSASANSEPLLGIHCGDRSFRSDDWEEMKAVADKLEDISKIIGGGLPAFSFLCAKYPFEIAERYEGDFQVEPAEPVLLVVNTLDAHTPPESAFNVSSGFKDSVVLEIDGHGVSILIIEEGNLFFFFFLANVFSARYHCQPHQVRGPVSRRLLAQWHDA